MFDFAIDLGQRLFAAHGQHGVAEAYEQDDKREVTEKSAVQPSQRILVQGNGSGPVKRTGRQLNRSTQHRDGAPQNQNHHHHRGDHHDLQSFLAGLVNALCVFPPEINHYHNGEPGGEMIVRKIQRPVEIQAHVFDEAGEILPGGNRADGAGEHVVEKQR